MCVYFYFTDAVQEPLSVTSSLLAKLIMHFLCFMCVVPNTEKLLKYLLKTEQTSAQGQACIRNLICMYLSKQGMSHLMKAQKEKKKSSAKPSSCQKSSWGKKMKAPIRGTGGINVKQELRAD